jgi:hypothetical protein
MTRKQFDNKVRGFIWLVKKNKGVELNQRYVEDAIFDFYSVYRQIPRLGVNASGNLVCAVPNEK